MFFKRGWWTKTTEIDCLHRKLETHAAWLETSNFHLRIAIFVSVDEGAQNAAQLQNLALLRFLKLVRLLKMLRVLRAKRVLSSWQVREVNFHLRLPPSEISYYM